MHSTGSGTDHDLGSRTDTPGVSSDCERATPADSGAGYQPFERFGCPMGVPYRRDGSDRFAMHAANGDAASTGTKWDVDAQEFGSANRVFWMRRSALVGPAGDLSDASCDRCTIRAALRSGPRT